MAGKTDKYQAQAELDLRAPNAVNLEKTINSILTAVEKLPAVSKDASSSVQEITQKVTAMATALKQGFSINSIRGMSEFKSLAADLKVLKTLEGGINLFSNKEVQNINAGVRALRQAIGAADELQKRGQVRQGMFGMDATSIKQVETAIKTLQADYRGLTQLATSTGRMTVDMARQGRDIATNVQNLQNYRTQLVQINEQQRLQLQRTQEQIKAEREQVRLRNQHMDQMAEAQRKEDARQKRLSTDGMFAAANMRQGYSLTPGGYSAYTVRAGLQNQSMARFNNTDYVAAQTAKQSLGVEREILQVGLAQQGLKLSDLKYSNEALAIRRKILALEKELALEMGKNGADSGVAKNLNTQLQKQRSLLAIQTGSDRRNDPDRSKADEAERGRQLMSRVTGRGGAGLLAAQTALIANYSLINTVSGSITGAISNSIELEAALKNIQAVTNTTAGEMAVLAKDITNVASASKFTSVEVANAALVLGQAGLSGRQVGEALQSIVRLATAAGTTLAEAVDLVTSVVGVFDKTTADTADVANKIVQAANSSKVSVDKLTLALQYVGNAASQTGVSFEETTAALAAMSNAGIRSGSTLGTGLRQFLTELQKPTEEFVNSLSRVGLSISDIDVRSKGLVGVIKTLQSAGFVASDAIRSFDVRGAAAFNALIANPDALQRQYEGLLNTKAAITASEIQMGSFDAQSKRLLTTLNNLAATGLEPVQTALTGIFRGISDGLESFAQMDGVLKGLITTMAALMATGIVLHFATIFASVAGGVPIIGGLATAFTALRTVKIADVAATVAQTTANIGATASLTAMNAGLIAGTVASAGFGASIAAAGTAIVAFVGGISVLTGIGLVIAGVAAAFFLLGNRTDESKKAMESAQKTAADSKAAYDASQGSVDALGKRIDALNYSQKALTTDNTYLSNTIIELNTQFGNLGFKASQTGTSFEELIGKLRRLRGEMREVAAAQLGIQLSAQQKVLGLQEQGYTQAAGDTRVRQNIQSLLNVGTRLKLDSNPNLSNEQRSMYNELATGLSKGSPDATSVFGVERMIAILRAAQPKDKLDLGTIDMAERNLAPLLSMAGGVVNQRQAVADLQSTQRNSQSYTDFMKSKSFGGKTFEETIVPFRNIFQDLTGEKDPVKKMQQAQQLLMPMLDSLRQLSVSDQITNLDSNTQGKVRQEINSRAEALRASYNTEFSARKPEIEQQLEKDARIAETQARGARSKVERDRLLAEAGRLRGQKALLSTVDPTERTRIRADQEERLAQARVEAAGSRDYKQEAESRNRSEIAAFRGEASMFNTMARGASLTAQNAKTEKELQDAIELGVQFITKSGSARMKALMKEQEGSGLTGAQDKARFTAEQQDLQMQIDEEVKNFREKMVPVYGKVIKGMNKEMLARLDRDKTALALQRSGQEDALFEAAAGARDVALRVAKGQLLPGSRAEKEEALKLLDVQAKQLNDNLSFLGNDATGYIGRLFEAIQNMRDLIAEQVLKLASVKDPTERRALEEALEKNRAGLKGLQDDYRGAVKDRNATRGRLSETEQQGAAARYNLNPPELTTDVMGDRMDQLATQYIQNMNMVSTYTEGMTGVLRTSQSAFGNFFMQLTDRSVKFKDAFRGMVGGIVRSLGELATQMLAMAAMKQFLQFLGFAAGAAGGGGATIGGFNGSAINTTGGMPITAASGGLVTGGIKGKDSVPAMLMPGEVVVNTKGVEAVGADFLMDLNNRASMATQKSAGNLVTSSTAAGTAKSGGLKQNIYIVTPDQMPSGLTEEDVKVIISQDIMTGGSIKQLVYETARGTM